MYLFLVCIRFLYLYNCIEFQTLSEIDLFCILLFASYSGGGLLAYSDSKSYHDLTGDAATTRKKRVVVLGTGWAATSFLKNLDISSYDVQVVSPRNYFAFTPLLPSVTCGTVEARSIVEPIRNIIKKVN